MAIDQISLNSSNLANNLITRLAGGGSGASEILRKSFGEPIPKLADIRHNVFLMSLFSQLGVLGRLQKKLSMLSRKKGIIVPAKGTVACALSACEETGNEDLVFVGVEFASEYHQEEETLAGVLAHEWGHLVSHFPKGLNPDEMSWDEIFAHRKEEEAAADAFAGKMLYLMRHNPEGLIRFLSKPAQENHKYHSIVTRAQIIREAYQDSKRRQEQAQKMGMTSQLIAIA